MWNQKIHLGTTKTRPTFNPNGKLKTEKHILKIVSFFQGDLDKHKTQMNIKLVSEWNDPNRMFHNLTNVFSRRKNDEHEQLKTHLMENHQPKQNWKPKVNLQSTLFDDFHREFQTTITSFIPDFIITSVGEFKLHIQTRKPSWKFTETEVNTAVEELE